MATTMNNLEKLIQMATIEQMYTMLNRMKENVHNVYKDTDMCNDTNSCKKDDTTLYNKNLELEISMLKTKNDTLNEHLGMVSEECRKLMIRIKNLEEELSEIKNNSTNNSKFLCNQIRGQQLLTSYPGFSNGSQKEENHIKLKIEEKDVEEITKELVKKEIIKVEEEEEEDEEEEETPLMVTCSTISIAPIKKEENVVKVEEEEVEEEEVEEEEVEEEVEEEEVGTEDETEVEVKPTQVNEIKKDEEEDEVEEVEEEEVEEEDEEVFELEIDDVTYFATDEENGIIYEMTSDGDIGKKVGIIKDGEPIFN